MVCVLCEHCGSEQLKRDGQSARGKQRYKCGGYGRRSCEKPYRGRPAEKEAQVLALHLERTSQRGISRTLKVSRVTVADLLKKKAEQLIEEQEQNSTSYTAPAIQHQLSRSHAFARTGGRGAGVG